MGHPQRRVQRGGRAGLLVLAVAGRREAIRPFREDSRGNQRRLPRPLGEQLGPLSAQPRQLCRREPTDVWRWGQLSCARVTRSRRRNLWHVLARERRDGRDSHEQRGRRRHQALRRAQFLSDARRRHALRARLRGRGPAGLLRLHLRAIDRRSRRRRHQGRRRQCPDEPEDFDGFKDEDGCPDPDNDNDGIPDVDDRCPNVPEDRDGDHDEDGCPEGGDGDRDGDGIPDSNDKCPDDPEDRDGFQDEDGCPDPDNDQDGIPDKMDKCPNDPEDKDGFEDQDGCPDPDNDQDGIPDVRDKCPNEPETYNGFEDEDGCPDKGSVIIQDNNIIILEKIKFMTDSAEILPQSNPILDAVATTFAHHPEFTLLEIAGHADERASDEHNLKLTQDRVNSVMRALIARGIAPGRLRSKGYGEFCPEDPGHNEAAWEKNRRVEFKIVKTKDGPTGVELGCENAVKHGVVPDPVP